MLPLIGITCGIESDRYYLTRYYSEGVRKAGGLPVILPLVKEAVAQKSYHQLLDGLILPGGGDVDPNHFGEEPLPGLGEISPERDFFELGLTKYFLTNPKPILAICRGMQVLNVAAGGSVCQHIEANSAVIKHQQEAPKWYPTHEIRIDRGTKLSKLFHGKNSVRVNSFHHQAVGRVAEGFKVSARAKDGIVEAIESVEERFWLGIQWHPECMWQEDELQHELFKGLVNSCLDKKTSKYLP